MHTSKSPDRRESRLPSRWWDAYRQCRAEYPTLGLTETSLRLQETRLGSIDRSIGRALDGR
jgi:hypothetical protein